MSANRDRSVAEIQLCRLATGSQFAGGQEIVSTPWVFGSTTVVVAGWGGWSAGSVQVGQYANVGAGP